MVVDSGTLSPLIARFVRRTRSENHYTANSEEVVRGRLNKLDRLFGGQPLSSLDRSVIEEYVQSMDGQALTNVRNSLSSVRVFCRWLTYEGHLRRDPTVGVTVRPRSRREIPVGSSCRPFMEEYLLEARVQGWYSEATVRMSRVRLADFATFFGDRPLATFDRRIFLEWFATHEDKAINTRNTYLRTLRPFCQWLVRHGHLAEDPSAGLRYIPVPNAPSRAHGPEALAAVLSACETPKELAVIWLMVGLGLRAIEISRAMWEDWDPTADTLLVHGKGNHERLLPVISPVATALNGVRHGHTTGPIIRQDRAWMAPTSSGGIQAVVRQVLYRSGIKQHARDGVGGHSLRHTAANDVLLRSGGDILVVQQMLGHSRLGSTHRYLGLVPMDRLREAMEGRYYGLPGPDDPAPR